MANDAKFAVPLDRSQVTPEGKRFLAAMELFTFAYNIKSHRLRVAHPDWDEVRVRAETVELIRRGCA